jgi:hypothetical protein
MTLREALNEACSNGSIYPGALNGNSYVSEDPEDTERRWEYIPNITSKCRDTYALTDDQLERVVLFADSDNWTPVNNFQF